MDKVEWWWVYVRVMTEHAGNLMRFMTFLGPAGIEIEIVSGRWKRWGWGIESGTIYGWIDGWKGVY